jgi:4-amino-4-deoxy-L-arabinose transferase-like glycosyltransferase
LSVLYRSGLNADLLVLVVALGVRLWALIDGMDAPTFYNPVVDAQTYDQAARALADGQGLDHRFFWQPFLYPVFLGTTYLLSAGSILTAKLLQLLIGVATCWLTLRVGRRLLGPGTGLIAGLICASHGPMVFFETELLAAGWATFWGILLLDRFTRAEAGDSRRTWLITGVLCAIAVLTRPTFLPGVILATGLVFWRAPRPVMLPRAGLAAGGFLLIVMPVMILGARVADYPGFVPASGAMNLYLGNHPEPCETLTIRPGEAWQELAIQARPAGGGDLNANREYFQARLVENVSMHPAAILGGMARKSVQLVSGRELPRNVDPYLQREWSGVLSVLMFRIGNFGFPMGLLLPLAGLGLWVTRRRLPPVFFVFVGLYLLGVVAVFVSARYRIPMVPALSILAASGMVAVGGAVSGRDWKTVGVFVLSLLVMIAVATIPGPFCEEEVDYRAETLYAVGYSLHQDGDLEEAATTYSMALEQRPDYVELLNQMGLLRSQQGRTGEAIALWSRAARIDSQHIAARMNLGNAYASRDLHADAFTQYESVLRTRPEYPDALMGAGFALLGMARFEEGVDHLVRAVQRKREFAPRLQAVAEALDSRGETVLAVRLRDAIVRAARP